MKSKLATTIAIATVTCSVLPLQATPTAEVLKSRLRTVGYLATSKCALSKGFISQAVVDELIVNYANEKSQYKTAIVWATTTTAGNSAVQALVPYFTSDCKGLAASDEEIADTVTPFVMQ